MNTSCPVADLSWWHWECSISARQIASVKFGTCFRVRWGLSGALFHPGSVSPCHSWFLCTGGSHQQRDVYESGWCSYQCHCSKGGTLVAQAQYLEVHLTILEPVLTSLHLILFAVDNQLARLQSSPWCYPLFHMNSASLTNAHGSSWCTLLKALLKSRISMSTFIPLSLLLVISSSITIICVSRMTSYFWNHTELYWKCTKIL